MSNTIVITNDGSHTLLSDQFGVSYHSLKGSIQESKTVFIDAGLGYFLGKKPSIKVLEMGFGTGLNAIMSAQFAFFHNAYIDYTGIEAFPIAKEDYQNLNYPEMLNLDENLNGIFQGLHLNSTAFSTYFIGQVIHQILEEYTTEEKYDVIYYDAFAPTSQAELWTAEIMQKMYGFLKPEGILVTYCAQGQFKRNLKEAGFVVEALPGPLGKREMTRAIKPSNNQY